MRRNWLLPACTLVLAANAWAADKDAPLDLGAGDVIDGPVKFVVKGTGRGAYLLTGIPQVDLTTQIVSYMTLSPVNPADVPPTPASKALFGNATQRPQTWAEARASCDRLGTAGKSWRLPDRAELLAMNTKLRFKEKVLAADGDDAVTPIARDYKHLNARFDDQFEDFWTGEQDETLGAGLRIAASLGARDGTVQSATVQRLFNAVCVTYFSGPETPYVVKLRENTAKRMAEAQATGEAPSAARSTGAPAAKTLNH